MAKKKAPAKKKTAIQTVEGDAATGTAQVAAPKLKPGTKRCPHCSGIVGARASTCTHCGKEIPVKGKKAAKATGKRGRKAKGDGVGNGMMEAIGFEIGHGIHENSIVDDAMKFIKSSGGIKNARLFLSFAEKFGAK